MQRSTPKRRITAAALAAVSTVGMMAAGTSSAAAEPATVGLWLCAGGTYATELNGRVLLDPLPNGGAAAPFASGVVQPGADCYKGAVPFGATLRINVRVASQPPLMESYSITTFTYVADQGMVIRAAGTLSAPDIQRYRRNV